MKLLLSFLFLFSLLHSSSVTSFFSDKTHYKKLLEDSGFDIIELPKTENATELKEHYKLKLTIDEYFDHLLMKTLFSTFNESQSKILKRTFFSEYNFYHMAFDVTSTYQKKNQYLILKIIMTRPPDFITQNIDYNDREDFLQKFIDEKKIQFSIKVDYKNDEVKIIVNDIDYKINYHQLYSDVSITQHIKLKGFNYIKEKENSNHEVKEYAFDINSSDGMSFSSGLNNYKQSINKKNLLSQKTTTTIERVYSTKDHMAYDYNSGKSFRISDNFEMEKYETQRLITTYKATTTANDHTTIDRITYKNRDDNFTFNKLDIDVGLNNLRSSSLIEFFNLIQNKKSISTKYLIRYAFATLLRNKIELKLNNFSIENMLYNEEKIITPLKADGVISLDAKDLSYQQLQKTPFLIFARLEGDLNLSISKVLTPFITNYSQKLKDIMDKYQKVEKDRVTFKAKLKDTIITINNRAIQ